MPRSGSTLVEQILASHPKVFGAGELTDFEDALAGLGEADDVLRSDPETVASPTGNWLHQLGASYVERVRALAPAADRIVDKMPANFRLAGLIHLALPNARIVHTVRDPIDTCLSCYSRLFSAEQNHTYDLAELGRFYRKYAELMAHWREALPEGRMLELRYEDVVSDLEGEARRMIA